MLERREQGSCTSTYFILGGGDAQTPRSLLRASRHLDPMVGATAPPPPTMQAAGEQYLPSSRGVWEAEPPGRERGVWVQFRRYFILVLIVRLTGKVYGRGPIAPEAARTRGNHEHQTKPHKVCERFPVGAARVWCCLSLLFSR